MKSHDIELTRRDLLKAAGAAATGLSVATFGSEIGRAHV